MINSLNSFPWAYAAIVLSVLFIIFVVLGIVFIRRTVNQKNLKDHHDVVGFVFTNIGVLYAVLLGFTVVNVQQRYDKVKETTEQEASYLAELYRDSEVFSEKNKSAIRTSIKNYCDSVINEEWPLMVKGNLCPHTAKTFKHLLKSYYEVELSDRKQEVWYSESVRKLNQLMSTRLARILGSRESLGAEMWTLLLLGAIIMVAFIWFFGLESLTIHILMGSILVVSTAFLIYLIYSLDTVYSGNIAISPDAMHQALHALDAL